MSRYRRHVFVCINERPKGHPKGCCLEKGSAEIRDRTPVRAQYTRARGSCAGEQRRMSGRVRFGVALVIYPDGIWYGGVRKEDVREIVERTIINGEVIENAS